MDFDERHPSLPIEAKESWQLHKERMEASCSSLDEADEGHRMLKHHHHHHKKHEEERDREKKKAKEVKRNKKLEDLYSDSGIQNDSMHGMMIDAGSSGSRMHVYEFRPRVLRGRKETSEAVAGKKLSYPGTDSRWTDRLKPGIAAFASLPEEELFPALVLYLQPLMQFAETILHSKNESFGEYPIYLKGTAGMRMLNPIDRARVINACRDIFSNSTYSRFKFDKDYARVISGEEEAIYGWAGANFVLGSLLKSSEGIGTVMNPELTYGTLELGGASSQIAFYQSNEDIMANLFKLHIGQGKHWNVYAHSFLYFGINEAWNRMGAYVATIGTGVSDIPSKVQNPCLAGGISTNFESTIYFSEGHETFQIGADGNKQVYQTKLINDSPTGDYDGCSAIVTNLIHKNYNTWCNFAHHGDCSFNGVYQPKLPSQSESFGEFLALSEYYDVFNFLNIPNRSSLQTLQNSTMNLCAMSGEDLNKFNNGRLDSDDLLKMCFNSVFAFQLLYSGFGFQMDDNITAADVVNGQKVGWALGSMLYEINTLPWEYLPKNEGFDVYERSNISVFFGVMTACIVLGLYWIFRTRPHHGYSRVEHSVQMVSEQPE